MSGKQKGGSQTCGRGGGVRRKARQSWWLFVLATAAPFGCFYGVDSRGRSGRDYGGPERSLPKQAVTYDIVTSVVKLERSLGPAQSLEFGMTTSGMLGLLNFATLGLRYYVDGTAPLGTYVGVSAWIPIEESWVVPVLPSVWVGRKGLSSRGTPSGLVCDYSLGLLYLDGYMLPFFGLAVGGAF